MTAKEDMMKCLICNLPNGNETPPSPAFAFISAGVYFVGRDGYICLKCAKLISDAYVGIEISGGVPTIADLSLDEDLKSDKIKEIAAKINGGGSGVGVSPCALYHQIDPLRRGIDGKCHGCRRCFVAGMSPSPSRLEMEAVFKKASVFMESAIIKKGFNDLNWTMADHLAWERIRSIIKKWSDLCSGGAK